MTNKQLIHFRNGKKQPEANPFDDHDEEWDENDNSENVLTDNGEWPVCTPLIDHNQIRFIF